MLKQAYQIMIEVFGWPSILIIIAGTLVWVKELIEKHQEKKRFQNWVKVQTEREKVEV